jgi:hypothetical protein
MLKSEFDAQLLNLLSELKKYFNISGDHKTLYKDIIKNLNSVLKLKTPDQQFAKTDAKVRKKIISLLKSEHSNILVYYIWIILNKLGSLQDPNFRAMISLSWLDELLFSKITKNILIETGISQPEADNMINLLRVLIVQSDFTTNYQKDSKSALHALFDQPESNKFLLVNRYQETLYFSKEAFEQLVSSFSIITMIDFGTTKSSASGIIELLKLIKIAEKCGYKVEELIKH